MVEMFECSKRGENLDGKGLSPRQDTKICENQRVLHLVQFPSLLFPIQRLQDDDAGEHGVKGGARNVQTLQMLGFFESAAGVGELDDLS